MTAVNAVVEPSSLPEQVQSRYQLKPSRFASKAATLYEGVDPASGKLVLVRVLRDDAFASAAERQRARRELQKLAQVRHESLAGVLDSGEAGDITWYARELVEGETLADRLGAKGALDAGATAWVGQRVAAALAELHRHGVQHRDLRPERVVLARDGSVRVLDAAVGRVTQLSDGRSIAGVPGYVAPEAITGRLVSFRSDLYALGATLYESLSGKPTFPVADPARRVQLQVEGDPVALDASAPDALTRLVFTLLAREQRDRPFSAQQVERQLEPFAKAPPAGPAEDLDAPGEGERTVAFDPSSAQSPGASDFDDRADDAPTRMHSGIDLPGSSTMVGVAAPALAQPSAPPAPAPAPAGAATVNARLPRMPTLPPIPSSATRSSMPGPVPAPAAAPPPPAAPRRKSTIVGMPMSDAPAAAPPPAAPSPGAARPGGPGKPGLDYDDLGDTTINDESRAFGLPGYVPNAADASQGGFANRPSSATPGIHGAVGATAGVGYDPMTSTVMAPSPVAVMAPGVGQPPPPNPMMQPMPGAPAVGAPPMAPPNPYGAGYAQQGAPMPQQGMPMPPQAYAPKPSVPSPGPAASQPSQVLPWIAGILCVIALASVGGLVVAKIRARDAQPPPEAVTIVPQAASTPAPTVALAEPSSPSEATPPPAALPPIAEPLAVAPPAPEPPAAVEAPAVPPPAAPPHAVVARVEPAHTQPAAHAEPAHTQPAARAEPAHTQPAVHAPVVARAQPAAQPAARPQPVAQPAAQPVVAARTQPAAAAAPAAGGPVSANDPRITEALRTRNYPQARTLLQGALRSQPNNAGLHAQLGNVYERLGNRADALNEYRAATRIDRRNTQYMHRLVDLLVATNDRAGAIATLRQILAIAPNDRAAQGRLTALGAQ